MVIIKDILLTGSHISHKMLKLICKKRRNPNIALLSELDYTHHLIDWLLRHHTAWCSSGDESQNLMRLRCHVTNRSTYLLHWKVLLSKGSQTYANYNNGEQ